jgi:hypothetical protein
LSARNTRDLQPRKEPRCAWLALSGFLCHNESKDSSERFERWARAEDEFSKSTLSSNDESTAKEPRKRRHPSKAETSSFGLWKGVDDCCEEMAAGKRV